MYLAHSQNPDYEFPFAVTLISFTTIVLKCLRSGKLNGILNDANDVSPLNELFAAISWRFMEKFIKTQSNVRHVNTIAEEVEGEAMKMPEKLIAGV